jgi:hypothetical protein
MINMQSVSVVIKTFATLCDSGNEPIVNSCSRILGQIVV